MRNPENTICVNDVMPFVQNGKNCENMWSGRKTKVEPNSRITNNEYFMKTITLVSNVLVLQSNLGVNH